MIEMKVKLCNKLKTILLTSQEKYSKYSTFCLSQNLRKIFFIKATCCTHYSNFFFLEIILTLEVEGFASKVKKNN